MSNNKKIVRIGVLGCAHIARRSVLPAIVSLGDRFKLVAVASRSRAKAETTAREFNCEAISDYDELVNSNQIDAVYVPLPTGLHKEWINKALIAGKHVYAEKSIAHSYSDAQEMIGNARRNNLAVMEGLMFQYHGQHQRVFELLRSNAIGEVRHFFGAFGFPPLEDGNFRYDEQLGGGALLDAAAYPLRAAHFILGDSLVVRGATLHIDTSRGINTYGSAFLANSDGLGAAIAFGFDNSYRCSYEIWGSKGKVLLTRAFTPRPEFSPEILLETSEGTRTLHAEPDNHFVRAFDEFQRTIVTHELREKHYASILLQSRSLEAIRKLASNPRIA